MPRSFNVSYTGFSKWRKSYHLHQKVGQKEKNINLYIWKYGSEYIRYGYTYLYKSTHINLLKSAHMAFPVDGMGKGKKTLYSSYSNSRYFVPGNLFLLNMSLGQLFMFSRAMFLITVRRIEIFSWQLRTGI